MFGKKQYVSRSNEELKFDQKKSELKKILALKQAVSKTESFETINPQKALWCYIELWPTICTLADHHYPIELKFARDEFSKNFYQDKLNEIKSLQQTVHNKLSAALNKVLEKYSSPDYFLENPKLISYAMVFSPLFLEKYHEQLPQIFAALTNLKNLEGMAEVVQLCQDHSLSFFEQSLPQYFNAFVELLFSSHDLFKMYFGRLEWLKSIQTSYPNLVERIIDKVLKDYDLFFYLTLTRTFDENVIDYFASLGPQNDQQRWKIILCGNKKTLEWISLHTTNEQKATSKDKNEPAYYKNEFNGKFFDGYQSAIAYTIELFDTSFKTMLQNALIENKDACIQYLQNRIRWSIDLKILSEKESQIYLETIRNSQKQFSTSKYVPQLIELEHMLNQHITQTLKIGKTSLFHSIVPENMGEAKLDYTPITPEKRL